MKASPAILLWLVLAQALAAQPQPASTTQVVLQSQGSARLMASGSGQTKPLSIALSDVLRLSLTVDGPPSLQVQGGQPLTSEAWIIETEKPITASLEKNQVRWRQTFRLDPMRPGKHQVLFAPLRYRFDKGDWTTVQWQPLTITVTTQVKRADPSELRDITAIEELPGRDGPSPWVVAGIAGLATAAVFGTVWWWRRRRAAVRPALSPEQWAERELERLLSLKLPEKQLVERFHTLLSNIVRGYLEKRFLLPARRQTTPEFLDAMTRSPQLAPTQQAFLRDFLQRCDLAKFAQVEPSPAESHDLAAAARGFIQETARNERSAEVSG